MRKTGKIWQLLDEFYDRHPLLFLVTFPLTLVLLLVFTPKTDDEIVDTL